MVEFTELTIKGKRFIRPTSDTDSINYFTGTDEVNIGVMLSHVPANRHGICVQAGGNLGYFPNAFAEIFDTVVTFEPDPVNFQCLSFNCSEPNIIKLQAALGYDKVWVEIEIPDERHVGLNQVKVGGLPKIPTLRIDDLALPGCDFIQLDLEGYEYHALQGAAETIKRFKPILAIELVGHSGNYGVTDDMIRDMIHGWGYQPADHVYNDVIFIPV